MNVLNSDILTLFDTIHCLFYSLIMTQFDCIIFDIYVFHNIIWNEEEKESKIKKFKIFVFTFSIVFSILLNSIAMLIVFKKISSSIGNEILYGIDTTYWIFGNIITMVISYKVIYLLRNFISEKYHTQLRKNVKFLLILFFSLMLLTLIFDSAILIIGFYYNTNLP